MNAPSAVKAVLDANILARFILTPSGFSTPLLVAIESGEVDLVTSEAILAEVTDVLGRRRVQRYKKLTKEEIDEAVEALRGVAQIVPGLYEIDAVSTDPKDNPILACALEGAAKYVVTDDRKDLLPMKHYHRIQIVSVPDFLKILKR